MLLEHGRHNRVCEEYCQPGASGDNDLYMMRIERPPVAGSSRFKPPTRRIHCEDHCEGSSCCQGGKTMRHIDSGLTGRSQSRRKGELPPRGSERQ